MVPGGRLPWSSWEGEKDRKKKEIPLAEDPGHSLPQVGLGQDSFYSRGLRNHSGELATTGSREDTPTFSKEAPSKPRLRGSSCRQKEGEKQGRQAMSQRPQEQEDAPAREMARAEVSDRTEKTNVPIFKCKSGTQSRTKDR